VVKFFRLRIARSSRIFGGKERWRNAPWLGLGFLAALSAKAPYLPEIRMSSQRWMPCFIRLPSGG